MKNIIGLIFLCCGFLAQAQYENTRCGSDDVMEEIYGHPEMFQDYLEGRMLQQSIAKSLSVKKSGEQVYIIPVVYHVVYWDASDSISMEQLQDGLDVLNEDFRRMNADTANARSIFKPLGADIKVEFRLAKIDPEGNPTTGVTYVKDLITLNANADVRTRDQWHSKHYFNIWTVRKIYEDGGTGTTLGYSFRPYPGQPGDYDGMVIRHDQVGRIGTALNSPIAPASQQRGRTMTHECGHYLGLAHPFENGCDTIFGIGDGIDDTPPVAAANFQCDFSANSCHNDSVDLPDMIENYMDYAPGTCKNLFTLDQKDLMRACFESSSLRALLVNQPNMERTGVLSEEENLADQTFKLYPNPAKSWVMVQSEASLKGAVISLTDISGKEIESWEVQTESNSFRVNLEGKNLEPGMYLVGISSTSGVPRSYHKLMVQ